MIAAPSDQSEALIANQPRSNALIRSNTAEPDVEGPAAVPIRAVWKLTCNCWTKVTIFYTVMFVAALSVSFYYCMIKYMFNPYATREDQHRCGYNVVTEMGLAIFSRIVCESYSLIIKYREAKKALQLSRRPQPVILDEQRMQEWFRMAQYILPPQNPVPQLLERSGENSLADQYATSQTPLTPNEEPEEPTETSSAERPAKAVSLLQSPLTLYASGSSGSSELRIESEEPGASEDMQCLDAVRIRGA